MSRTVRTGGLTLKSHHESASFTARKANDIPVTSRRRIDSTMSWPAVVFGGSISTPRPVASLAMRSVPAVIRPRIRAESWSTKARRSMPSRSVRSIASGAIFSRNPPRFSDRRLKTMAKPLISRDMPRVSILISPPARISMSSMVSNLLEHHTVGDGVDPLDVPAGEHRLDRRPQIGRLAVEERVELAAGVFDVLGHEVLGRGLGVPLGGRHGAMHLNSRQQGRPEDLGVARVE